MKYLLILLITLSGYSQITIDHTYYSIRYDTISKYPLYTHYSLDSTKLINRVRRSKGFILDNKVKSVLQGESSDYKYTGWDKGHLSPNDDFRFDKVAEAENMIYTNVAPQNPKLNAGVWKALEIHARSVAKYYSVEIWTGCIYGSSKTGKIFIPTHFWKLIKYSNMVEAYMIPNEVPTKRYFQDYKVNPNNLITLIK